MAIAMAIEYHVVLLFVLHDEYNCFVSVIIDVLMMINPF